MVFLGLVKKAVEMGRYYGSEALRDPKLQKKAIIYALDKLNPMIHNVGSQALDQLSTKIRPKKKYKTGRKDLDGAGIIDKDLKSGIFGSPWQVDCKKGFQLLTDPTLFKGPNLSKEQMKENVKRYKQLYKQAKENGYKGSYAKFVKEIGVASGPTFTFPGFGGSLDIHKAIVKLPKPKKGWTLPGHKYTESHNDLDSQLKYNPQTGEILEIYDQPTGKTDAIAMQHDVDYSVCKDNKKCKNNVDRKMVNALDSVPYDERQWGHWLARNMINTKQKLGLGVKKRKPKNGKGRLVRKIS